ncbi:MAG TPA: CPBP family glutamic-type intramembrane protease [Terracidiphilus sp.]|nr:CPBP family glutamic-type intramembrane protease [Terracidiphilus sp.]
MPPAREIASSPTILINSPSQIRERMAAGRIQWIGPLLLVSGRSALWLTLQSLLALVFLAQHRPAPFRTAGQWWPIYANLGDLGCLLGMKYFTRKEGIHLLDLIGPIRLRWGRDLFLGLGIFILAFPCAMFGSYLAQILVYGSLAKTPVALILQAHSLPLWATVYSLTVWWIIQSPTEDMTYQGYVLPRLEALTGRTWIAFLIVLFWFSVQHCMFPFIPDWRYVAYRSLMMVPILVLCMVVYLRIRRLSPIIIAHWPMDISVAIMTGTHLGAVMMTGAH